MKVKRSIGMWTAVEGETFTYSVWAIAGAGDDIVTKGFLLLLCGIPVYVAMRWWERRKAEHLELPAESVEPPAVMAGGDRAH